MSQRTTTAIVTGQLRDPLDAINTFSRLIALRSDNVIDEIIFSTWFGEADRIENFRQEISNAGIHLVESESPPHSMAQPVTINLWMQMKMLENGLSVADSNSQIFKLRTDKCLPFIPIFEKWIKYGLPEARSFGNLNPIFKRKMAVKLPKSAFFLHYRDALFLGDYDDVKRNISYDGSYDAQCVGGSIDPESRFFIRQFYDGYDYVKNIYSRLRAMRVAQSVRDWANERDDTPLPLEIIEILAVNAILTWQNFTIPETMAPVEDTDFYELFSTQYSRLVGQVGTTTFGPMTFFAGEWVLEATLNGKLRESQNYNRFIKVVNDIRETGRLPSCDWDPDNKSELRTFLRRFQSGETILKVSKITRVTSDKKVDIGDYFDPDRAYDLLFKLMETPQEDVPTLLSLIQSKLSPNAIGMDVATFVGDCLLWGREGINQNVEAGIRWLQYAIGFRNTTAMYSLGRYFVQEGRIEEAKNLLEGSARRIPEAAKLLSEITKPSRL